GRHAPRAAWKYGWWQYKLGDAFAEAADAFERGSLYAPRSDYRPAWLYWAGRSRENLGQHDQAAMLYRIAITDYRHSYYGRLAQQRLQQVTTDVQTVPSDALARVEQASPGSARTSNSALADIIQRLLVAGLWDEAILEIEDHERTAGASAELTATLAYAYAQKGDLRRGIVLMKRAYPQYLAEGGEQLPREILEVIFPVAHWDLIRKQSASKKLDPYLVAALVAQESTFDEDARSSANARGLMQIMPATGRRLARAEKVARFTVARLNEPELNVRLGTRYLASLVERFGELHFALASYNAGESRVVRWRAERPGLAAEEFIDDIPFPETQNYVKKIIGTAADYRTLYPNRSGE
ncbi:MAG: transglycosylase SLT domain-containing protein, partial [Vicinamibacterales bacterium]